jgi:ABC-type multidrug transport system fused ATPase/permease subunit
LEVVAALLVLLLLGILTKPDGGLVLPVAGDLRDRFPGLSESDLLLGLCALIGVFFVVRASAYLLQSYLQNRISADAGARLARRLLEGYMAAPYVAHLRRNSAELIRNAHESVTHLSQQVFTPSVGLASESLLTFAVFVTLLATRPLMTLSIVAVLGPIVVAILKIVQPRLLASGQLAQQMTEESLRSLTESLEGIRDIKVLGKGPFFEERFGETRARLARAISIRGMLIDVPRIALETSLVLFVLAYVGIAVGRDPSTQGTIASLGLFGYAAMRVLPSLNRITNNLQSLKFARPIMDALYEEVCFADAAVRDAEALRGHSPSVRFERAIALRNVTFRYEGGDGDALADVDLTIRRGEFVGIIGPTGGGKSTLIDVVVGLLAPTFGEVTVDDVPIAADPAGWYAHIGMVPQRVFLVDDTLRRNIALGTPDDRIDDAAVAEAVEVAQLASLVEELPAGLESRVGERGVRLSGGQRQRLAIARALYRRPDVLVFDEGTSALDDATEAALVGALERLRGEHTLLAVAHRLTTVQHCDRVVVVERGRITRVGAFDEVVANR